MQVCGLASAMMLVSMAEREQTRGIYTAKLLLFQWNQVSFQKKLYIYLFFAISSAVADVENAWIDVENAWMGESGVRGDSLLMQKCLC